jgi:MFS family permease
VGPWSAFNQLALTSGILVSYLVDYGLAAGQNWRLMFGLAAIPAVLMFTGMLFQHESPHWLIAQGREDEAREVLRRVRDEAGIDAEIAEVRELSARRSSFREVLNPAMRHVMVIGVALAVFQQITGINTIIYYAPTLLSSAGLGNSAALLANVVNGAVNVAMTIVAIRLLDRTGRRPLLLGGTTGMAAGMIVVALTFAIGGSHLHGGAAYIAIAGLLIYTGSFAIGLGPVFWLLISEIYPVKIRGQAMSVATMANWGANFVVTISFLTLLSAIGNAGTFFLFAGLSIVALVYFQRQVPETKNRSLQDIERDLDLPGHATAGTTAPRRVSIPRAPPASPGTPVPGRPRSRTTPMVHRGGPSNACQVRKHPPRAAVDHRGGDPALISVADGENLQAPSGGQAAGAGRWRCGHSRARGAVPVDAVRRERAVVLHIGEDSGSGEFFVHPGTQNPPGSQNTPR